MLQNAAIVVLAFSSVKRSYSPGIVFISKLWVWLVHLIYNSGGLSLGNITGNHKATVKFVIARIIQDRYKICWTSRRIFQILWPYQEPALQEEISFETNWKAEILRQSLRTFLSVTEEGLCSASLQVRCVQEVMFSFKCLPSHASLLSEEVVIHFQ